MSRRKERLSNYLGTLVSSPKRASNTAPFWSLSAIRGSTGATLTNDVFRASLPESCTSSTNVTLSRALPPETSEEHSKSTRSSTSVRQSESPQLEVPVDGQRGRSLRRKSEGNGRLGRQTRQTEDQTSHGNTRRKTHRESCNNDEVLGDEVERLSQLENNLSFVLKVLHLHETFLQRKFQLEFEEFATPLEDEVPRVRPTSLNTESSATFHSISTSSNATRRSSEESLNPSASLFTLIPIGVAVDSNAENLHSGEKDFVEPLESKSSLSDAFGGDELQREEEENEFLRDHQTDCKLFDDDDEDFAASDETSVGSSTSEETSESAEEPMRREVPLQTRTTKLKIKRESGEMRRSETSKGRLELECPICHKSYRTKRYLRQHKLIHNPERKWKCSECPKTFLWAGNLRDHEWIHTNEKPFQCSLCSKTFRNAYDTKRHERIHLNEKPFKCYFCPKAFTEKGTLVIHERIHSGERPFKCSLCPKAFTQKGSLVNHERIHSGERPFKCSFCVKAFARKDNLLYHERIHSGETARGPSSVACVRNLSANRLI